MKPFYYFEYDGIHIKYVPDNEILTEKIYKIKSHKFQQAIKKGNRFFVSFQLKDFNP